MKKYILFDISEYDNQNTPLNEIVRSLFPEFKSNDYEPIFLYKSRCFLFVKEKRDKDGPIFIDSSPMETFSLNFSNLIFSFFKNPFFFFKITFYKIMYKAIKISDLKQRYKIYTRIYRKYKFSNIFKITWYYDCFESLLLFKNKRNIDFFIYTVDPIYPSPLSNKQEGLFLKEKKAISEAKAYFVPYLWQKEYHRFFANNANIYELKFPLLKENVFSKKIFKKTAVPTFIHFGNLYDNRIECDYIFRFFESHNFIIDIYGEIPERLLSKYKCLIKHKRIMQSEAEELLNSYDFFICFDNTGDRINFLPSKCVSYISYLKPIIVVGPGKNNTETFFSSYSPFLYLKKKDDLERLACFINEYHNYIPKDKKMLEKYKEWSPTQVFSCLANKALN